MNRDEFFALAKKHGHESGKAVNIVALRQELLDFFASTAGQDAISCAPLWHREASIQKIVDALIEELKEPWRGEST